MIFSRDNKTSLTHVSPSTPRFSLAFQETLPLCSKYLSGILSLQIAFLHTTKRCVSTLPRQFCLVSWSQPLSLIPIPRKINRSDVVRNTWPKSHVTTTDVTLRSYSQRYRWENYQRCQPRCQRPRFLEVNLFPRIYQIRWQAWWRWFGFGPKQF